MFYLPQPRSCSFWTLTKSWQLDSFNDIKIIICLYKLCISTLHFWKILYIAYCCWLDWGAFILKVQPEFANDILVLTWQRRLTRAKQMLEGWVKRHNLKVMAIDEAGSKSIHLKYSTKTFGVTKSYHLGWSTKCGFLDLTEAVFGAICRSKWEMFKTGWHEHWSVEPAEQLGAD